MIAQVDIFNYKALRAVRVPLSPYQLLIGPNGAGKSSVFDALLLITNSMLGDGPQQAIRETGAETMTELTHCKEGGAIAVSVLLKKEKWPALRYSVVFSQIEGQGVSVAAEAVTMHTGAETLDLPGVSENEPVTLDLFRKSDAISYVEKTRKHCTGKQTGWKRLLYKTSTGADTFIKLNPDPKKKDWQHQTQLSGTKQLTLKFAPSEKGYEYVNWVKNTLLNSPTRVQLDIDAVRFSGSPEKSGEVLTHNGDNFSNVVASFKERDPENFRLWLSHVRSFIPDISSVDFLVRPENKRITAFTVSPTGIEVPQYLLSDGTLRFLALTLLAFSSNSPRFLLIEEPENGLHPRVIEGVLSPFAITDEEQQVLFASHSPIVLANFQLDNVIVFQKPSNSTELCKAVDHPALSNWIDEVNKADLLAAGIL